MHISEGILGIPALASGFALSTAGVAVGLKKLDPERLPQTAVLTSAFFVASLVHINFGGVSTHLMLNGLVGLILGWAAFPALLVALLLQAAFFGHGGLTTLGANTLTMALPGVLCHYALRHAITGKSDVKARLYGFAAGVLGPGLAGLLFVGFMATNGEGFLKIGAAVFVCQLPVMFVEGLITATVVTFIRRVRPEIFSTHLTTATVREELSA